MSNAAYPEQTSRHVILPTTRVSPVVKKADEVAPVLSPDKTISSVLAITPQEVQVGSPAANAPVSVSTFPPRRRREVTYSQYVYVRLFSPTDLVRHCKYDQHRQARKSILKASRPSRDADRLTVINEESQRYRVLLQKGSNLSKFNYKGRPESRQFTLSEDCTELVWRKNRGAWSSRIVLASVKSIVFGPHALRFAKYNWDKNPWLCFSIVCDNRTLDIECSSEAEFSMWYLGLQHFVPLASSHLNRGALIWTRAMYKVSQRAQQAKTSRRRVWVNLFINAKFDCTWRQ